MRALSWVLSTERWVSLVCSVGAHEPGIKQVATVVKRVRRTTWEEKTAGREKWRLKREQRNGFEDITEWRPGRRKNGCPH